MVLEAASTDRLLGSWGVNANDPNDLYGMDGLPIANRGEWLYNNDAIQHAIVETLLNGTLGPQGLKYRSTYQADNDAALTDSEKTLRKEMEAGIRAGTRARSFDAGGVLTRRDMSKVILTSTINNGSGFSIRCWKPDRPGRHSHATCWRIPHATRISNPQFKPNSDTLRDGMSLDADGVPIGLNIQRVHPNSLVSSDRFTWDYVPWYDADGFPNITWHAAHRLADQLRPTGWATPIIQLLRLFGRTLQAKTVADVLKASMGLIVECDDPVRAAKMDRNGAVLDGTSKILPGKCYYVKKGTIWKTLDFQYNGQDFEAWQRVIVTNICAAYGVPYQFVQMNLTQANMASSRVALLQAYRTFHGHQNDLIDSTEDVWNHSLIREDLVRGRLSIAQIDADTLDRLCAGRYLRPARFMPDPLKEAQAADVLTKRLGFSYSTVYGDMGADTETEWADRESNDKDLAMRGIVLQGDGSVMAPAPNQTPPQGVQVEDPANDPADDQVPVNADA